MARVLARIGRSSGAVSVFSEKRVERVRDRGPIEEAEDDEARRQGVRRHARRQRPRRHQIRRHGQPRGPGDGVDVGRERRLALVQVSEVEGPRVVALGGEDRRDVENRRFRVYRLPREPP